MGHVIGAVGEAKVLDGLPGWTLHSSTPADARKIGVCGPFYSILQYGNLVRGTTTSVWSVVRYGTAYAHKVHGFTVFRAETRARNYGTPALYGK